MKIKSVGVIIQNFIQYESFLPAINIMKERNISVDLLIPIEDMSEHIWDNMYAQTMCFFEEKGLKVKKGVQSDICYDILFATHDLEEFHSQKRKYFIKYRYGIANKTKLSVNMRKNLPFDLILCYGKKDSEMHENFSKTYEIGNIKYANYQNIKERNKKKVVLYLPTYGVDNTSLFVVPELAKLKRKFDIRIKLHHGTNYLLNDDEKKVLDLVNQNFNVVYDSTTSLLEIIHHADVIISDNSGAIGDAIAAGVPIILSPKDGKFLKYGDYTCIAEELVNKGLAEIYNSDKNLLKVINCVLKRDNSKILKESFDLLYCCNNVDTINMFCSFLDDLEKGLISDDYLLIRKNMQQEYKELEKNNENNEIQVEVLTERLDNAYKIIDNLSKEKK